MISSIERNTTRDNQLLASSGQALKGDPAKTFDIAIVGGGIVGLTLAALLKDSGLSIAVVEAQSQSVAAAKGQAYALHLISSRIFSGIGVWADIAPQVEPFKQVRLSDADYPHRVDFQPADLNTEVLGHVAEHGVLLRALQNFLQSCENVTWFCPAEVTQTHCDQSGVRVELSPVQSDSPVNGINLPTTLQAKLLIGADGSRSPIRTKAGISTHGWQYWQSCVVVTVATEKPHHNTAYERFWPSGPFAILPLSGNRCRIVWTSPHAEAERILHLDEPQFLQELSQRFGHQLGQLSLLSRPFLFPARLMHTQAYSGQRLALIGDAAHTCHPVGGQGLNLGIRDAAALAEVLQTAHQRGEDIGSQAVLRRYQNWRNWENWATLAFTDFLDRLFSNQCFPLVVGRRLGLRVMQKLPFLRIAALRFMAGLSGRVPQIARLESNS
uniref:Ubiquinone biosynthesis hydroxylase, UbiH/UbiF/VisC/COQ6 family n=1 Tax=Cyanothece sp. (strain PCC 7425 / ATCC 29141) TaxID=395961 RepID=B8HUD3_CYAP4